MPSAYPDGHTDKDTNEDGEIENLKAKVDAGADFIVTQLFYDVDGFLRWEKKVRQKGWFCQSTQHRVVVINYYRYQRPHHPWYHAHTDLFLLPSINQAVWCKSSSIRHVRSGAHLRVYY